VSRRATAIGSPGLLLHMGAMGPMLNLRARKWQVRKRVLGKGVPDGPHRPHRWADGLNLRHALESPGRTTTFLSTWPEVRHVVGDIPNDLPVIEGRAT